MTDSTFYEAGKLKSFGKYDSLNKYWRYYSFYETGQMELSRELSPIYFWDVDTSIVYHRNGNIAWIFPYTDSALLTGKLIGYYQDGSIKREAYYYRGFRTGIWKEYYPNGKTKSISNYEITPEDSAFVYHMPVKDDKNGFTLPKYVPQWESEYFSWGESDSDYTSHYNVVYNGTRFITSTFISKKTGKWKTYDFSGKLRAKRLTDFDSTIIVKELIGRYGLTFETVKEIYEKCNSLEELAQLLQENDTTYSLKEFLQTMHEASANFLETLNEPRSALGLTKLTFKEKSKEKIQNQ